MKPFSMGNGQLKQELAKDYQEVYLELFEFGTKNQRLDIIGNKLLFLDSHRRVFALKTLDRQNREFSRIMDVMLIDQFKERFKMKLIEKYGFQIVTILKDYDPASELTATVIVLDQDVANYLQN
ncbi:Uncharacterized conserved protein [Paenibacillus sp. 1_12]|uniref:Na-translocating system protein MpsC family protein n=1 Tax=Paenibacillus sp. 1_12 TaxID=1566278 RepID=UPI0008E39F43|nr:Na-translocating system protein MpsC family protein [Paenibacillus sp. 1_12]SFL59129.1 Uncharacterized conserved protein [Paenibacillus sp. 1_12]